MATTYLGLALCWLMVAFIAHPATAEWVWKEDDGSPQPKASFADIFGHHYSHNSVYLEENNGGSVSSSFLDVHHPDSPYGLIQDVLKPTPLEANINDLNLMDLGGLESNEVWLSQGDLLVLKGGITNQKNTFWPPLDDYEAPIRQSFDDPLSGNNLASNIISSSNGIVSVLPPPRTKLAPTSETLVVNRQPRTHFSPSVPVTVQPLPSRNHPSSGFVPVTPSWLKTATISSSASPNSKIAGFDQLLSSIGNSAKVVKSNAGNVREAKVAPPSSWSQVPGNVPIFRQMQRPHQAGSSVQNHPSTSGSVVTRVHSTSANNAVVRHGIVPIVKPRHKHPVTYNSRRHYYNLVYKH